MRCTRNTPLGQVNWATRSCQGWANRQVAYQLGEVSSSIVWREMVEYYWRACPALRPGLSLNEDQIQDYGYALQSGFQR